MKEALQKLNEIAKKINIEVFYSIIIDDTISGYTEIRLQTNYNHEYISNLLEKFDDVKTKITDIGYTEIIVDNLKFVFT